MTALSPPTIFVVGIWLGTIITLVAAVYRLRALHQAAEQAHRDLAERGRGVGHGQEIEPEREQNLG